jgi:tripartite-type tricarboxylate transporter receptor subunit TctC
MHKQGSTMKLRRRRFLQLAGAAMAAAVSSRLAWAQSYPARPVRLIVGFAAGGVTDIVARLLGQWLSERLGQQFIVENRSGSATNIATEAVVRAVPDGYTLLMASASNAINATLYHNLDFNFMRDTAPIASALQAKAEATHAADPTTLHWGHAGSAASLANNLVELANEGGG